MTDTPLKVSSKFPEGYGNLAIQSCDDVVCYFPGPILTHTSTVFRDMFKMPKPEAEASSPNSLMKITEPIEILEAFLAHLDPNALTPSIDPDTIKDLLCMADKYQVAKILLWFEQEARLRRSDSEAETVSSPFVITHPIVCLSVATRFNFQHIGRIALRDLSGCSSKVFLNCILKLNPGMLYFLYQLRNRRIARYQKYVARLTELRREGCEYCTGLRAEWIRRFVLTIQDTPTWAKFKETFNDGLTTPCRRYDTCWSVAFVDKVPVWEKEIRQEDSKLPDWPL
jgi:hypothetical protein